MMVTAIMASLRMYKMFACGNEGYFISECKSVAKVGRELAQDFFYIHFYHLLSVDIIAEGEVQEGNMTEQEKMTAQEKAALIDDFNHESRALETEEENLASFAWSLARLIDTMNKERFSVVFRPVEMSDGWEWVEAQEVRDGT